MYHPADFFVYMFPPRDTFSPHVFCLKSEALICQDEGLVPIVEPDIVMKGDGVSSRGPPSNHLPASQNR